MGAAWIEFPRIRVQLLVQVDVAEWIDDVMPRRNQLSVNVYVRSHVLSHRGVRLRQPSCLVYQGIEDWGRTFPYIQRDLREGGREIGERSANLIGRRRVGEHQRSDLCVSR